MLRLRSRQRAVMVEKLPDVANLGVGALVFGQFVGEQPFSPWLALGRARDLDWAHGSYAFNCGR